MTSTGPTKPNPSGAMAGALSPPNTNSTLERDRELVIQKNKQWQRELLMERIRARSSQRRSLGELSKAVRMNMMDKRGNIDAVERANLRKALYLMQNCIKTNTRQGLSERLESLSRQLGLKFMEETNTLYISSDMFFLEITVESNGTLLDVKVHHECIEELVSCKELLEYLKAADFVDFTSQLEGLTSIYQLNAEPKVKTKAFVALQAMEKDIDSLYSAQNLQSSIAHEMLFESKVGLVFKRRGGHPMKLSYFISPYDMLQYEAPDLTLDMIVKKQIGYYATLNLEAGSANKLQIAPIVSLNAETNTLVYAKLNSSNSMMLPATFVLRLNKPLPVCLTALRALGLGQSTNSMDMSNENNGNGNALEIGDAESNGSILLELSDLDDSPVNEMQTSTNNNTTAAAVASTGIATVSEERNVVNLMHLIVQTASEQQMRNSDRGMFVTLPEQTHCYFFSDTSHLQGTLLQSVPFTDPSQVPAIIDFLKEQALFYALLSSCVRPNAKVAMDMENTTILEISAKNLKQIHITLQHPYDECMVDVELELNSGNVTARIYTYLDTFEELSIKLSRVVQASMSIPIGVPSLLQFWEKEHMKQFQCNTGLGSMSQSSTSPLHVSSFSLDSKSSNSVCNVAGLSISNNSTMISMNQTVSSSTSEGSLNSMSGSAVESQERQDVAAADNGNFSNEGLTSEDVQELITRAAHLVNMSCAQTAATEVGSVVSVSGGVGRVAGGGVGGGLTVAGLLKHNAVNNVNMEMDVHESPKSQVVTPVASQSVVDSCSLGATQVTPNIMSQQNDDINKQQQQQSPLFQPI